MIIEDICIYVNTKHLNNSVAHSLMHVENNKTYKGEFLHGDFSYAEEVRYVRNTSNDEFEGGEYGFFLMINSKGAIREFLK